MVLNKPSNPSLFFIIGCVGIFCALGSFYVEQRLDLTGIAFIISAVLSFALFFIRLKSARSVPLVNIAWKEIFICFFVCTAALGILAAVNYLAFKSRLVWDVTKYKQHTLTQNTVDYIAHLKNDISITVFFVGMAPKYLEDLLDGYKKISKGKIEVEIIDPIRNIGYAARFGTVISDKESRAFIKSGKESREIDFTGLALTEEDLTNAIIRVTRPAKKVYFLVGHNEADIANTKETGFSAFKKLLDDNNYSSQTLFLGAQQKSIPADCDVMIIAGPKKHLSDDENKIISDYLEHGGDALFLVENIIVTTPETPLTEEQKSLNPSMNEILENWGVHVADDIALDLASYVGEDVGSPATRNYMPHQALIKDVDYTFYIRPRTISQMPSVRPSLKAAPFVLTTSEKNSWGETDRMLKVKYDEGIDRLGPVPISYVIWDAKGDKKPSDTRIIVFTDSDFLTNAFLDKYSNAKMGLNIINWIAELDYQVFLGKKEIEVNKLELTSRQKRIVLVLLFIMPLGIALSGIYVWMRRK